MSWPWPNDSREDRAKRVALAYRRALELVIDNQISDPATALATLDAKWIELGQGWVVPTSSPLRLDDWLTGREMAELFYQAPKTIYNWGVRARIRVQMTHGQRRYCVGDVVEYMKVRRTHEYGSDRHSLR